jgi:hypothetical protein
MLSVVKLNVVAPLLQCHLRSNDKFRHLCCPLRFSARRSVRVNEPLVYVNYLFQFRLNIFKTGC